LQEISDGLDDRYSRNTDTLLNGARYHPHAKPFEIHICFARNRLLEFNIAVVRYHFEFEIAQIRFAQNKACFTWNIFQCR